MTKQEFIVWSQIVNHNNDKIVENILSLYDVELHGESHWVEYALTDAIDIDVHVEFFDDEGVILTAYPIYGSMVDRMTDTSEWLRLTVAK